MKSRLLILFAIGITGFMGFTFADHTDEGHHPTPQPDMTNEFDTICNHSFCIVNTNPPDLPITNKDIFILDILTNAGQSLDVKITNWSDEIVYSEYLNSNDDGIVSIRWNIPDEYYFGTFKVVVSEKDNQNPHGFTFRIGDDPYHPKPIQNHIVVKESTGKSLHSEGKNVYENNETIVIKATKNEFETDPPPYLPIKILVHDQEDNLIRVTELVTDDKGYFEYFFTPNEIGLYKIELISNHYDVWSGKYIDFIQTRYIPVELKGDTFSIFAENEEFPIQFEQDYYLFHTINNITFNQSEKHLSIEFEEIQPRTEFNVIIPHKLLNNNYTIFLNDKLLDPNENRNSLQHVYIDKWKGFTGIEVNTEGTGFYKLDVYGTSAIPEFGVYAMIILAASILPIIFARNKLILR